MALLNPAGLLTSRSFYIGFAIGVVAGAAGYKYVVVDKKLSASDLSSGILSLAKKVGGSSEPAQNEPRRGQHRGASHHHGGGSHSA